ncbi:MAG: hypothetical protein IT356_04730 [Gemmatimonadaceae bacterium]|nr:hypothetical protein [Gemmatimonadaceae bacterium]
MARQLTGSAAVVAVMLVGGVATAAAQPRMNRGPSADTPRLMVSACHADDKALAVQCADKIRSQIEGDVSVRSLVVLSKSDIESTLSASGYDPSTALAPGDATALAKQVRADMYVDADVSKAGDNYKVVANVVLARDQNMRQPIGTYEHARIETIAQQVSRAFQDVFNRTFDKQKDCFLKERERKYDDAMKDALAGIKDFPGSAWLRYCELTLQKDQKKPSADVIATLTEILKIDPMSRSALNDLVTLYDATGQKEKMIETLMALHDADPGNIRLVSQIINSLAAEGQFDKARPLAEKAVAENPGELSLVRPYWLILMNAKEYKKAIEVGKRMVTMDTSMADTAYFFKMIAAAGADSNFAEAADLSNAAATKFPAVADYHTYAVALYRKAGNTAKSIEAAQRALKLNPKLKDLRAQIASGYLGDNPPKVDDAIRIVKEMIANGEDKEQIAGIAVTAGNTLRTLLDSARAKGADAEAMRTATAHAFEVTSWADTLATGTAVAPQAKFVMGVTALNMGQIFLTDAGDIGKKLQEDYKAAPDAKKKAVLEEAYPRACAAANKANSYFTIAQGAVPAGGRFAPQAAQQVMGSLMQLNGYVEQMTKAYCKAP